MKNKVKKMIPNIITMSRLISLIFGFVLFIMNRYTLSFTFYIYGALSDAFDGYFARKYDAYSKFGKYLDATSDKLYTLSLIILLLINRNYFIIILMILELIIAIINYLILHRKGKIFIERVGKIKTVFVFSLMIVALLSIRIKDFNSLFFPLCILALYFEIQTIIAYINQYHGKSKEIIVNFNGKKLTERIKLLFREFISYLVHPTLKIK